MPSGRLILVRHGETLANVRRVFAESDDIPLTETGRAQAEKLALRLANEFKPDRLVSSHFARARETAAIIGRALGLTAEHISGIHERDFGALKGHPYERIAESPHVPEPLDKVRSRAMAAIETLLEVYPTHEIVVVCHGAVIQAICAHITGVWTEAAVPPNCGIVVISWDEGGFHPPQLSGDWITPFSSSAPDKPQP